jgi:predicted DNA-binding transcriptional regulator YafY
MRQRLYVDTTAWYGRTEDLSALPIVQDALSRDRQLWVQYARGRTDHGAPAADASDGRISERTVHPLGLVAKGATWYLVANTIKGYRTFRVSRIREARVLDAACERPQDFDLASHWRAATSEFIDSRRRYAATLRMEPSAATRLKEWFRETTDAGSESRDDGRVTVHARFDDEAQALFIVLGFGARAEVIDPPSLREQVARELNAMLLTRTSSS